MEKERKIKGFTLVELLTVMSIIAILIGILVPALSAVKKIAKDVSQKAQLHSIGVALDMFSGEMDGYPKSTILPSTNGEPDAAPYTVGAMRLAEALVGRDMLGFDTASTWDAEADDTTTTPIPYASRNAPWSTTIPEEAASLARRKGPYINPENIDAYSVGQLYATTTNVYSGMPIATKTPAPVLTDIYRVKDVALANGKTVKAGTPILYYKANTSLTGSTIFPNTQITGTTTLTTFTSSTTETQGYIYDSLDNEYLIKLGHITDSTKQHHFDGLTPYTDVATSKNGRWIFYDTITNSKITSQPRPYNADTYILISAGYDGLYGTKDDITNFGE